MDKQYWRGFEELQNTPEFAKHKHDEFREDLPVLSEIAQMAGEQQATRRDFLKILGFSIGAAAVAASCEIPVKKSIPYVFKPEEITPGVANYYASSFINGSDYCSILVKTREGRPIKIEGNPLSGVTHGGTSARTQAAVVSLYDGARLRYPKRAGKKTSWGIVDAEIKQKLASTSGDIVILTTSIISPSTKQAIRDFQARYPQTKHVVYEPVSNAGMLYANEKSFGRRVIPSYNFDKAEVVVSIGADFLGTWVSPIEFAKQYSKTRKLSKDNSKISKHWQFESYMSLTGSNADKRISVKPSEEGLVALALLAELGGSVSGASIKDAALAQAVKQAAMELKAAQGRALVVAGTNDPDVQTIVNAINEGLGSYGNTIDFSRPYNAHQGDDRAMNDLVSAMNNGSVGALFIYGVNPAYSYPKADQFVSGLKKIRLTVSFNDREDETSENIAYLCPDSHFLESWNDAEIKKGFYSLVQPTIAPLFDTRQAQESLLRWSDNSASYYDYIRAYWKTAIFGRQSKFNSFRSFWDAALHDGVFEVDNANKTSGPAILGAMDAGVATDSLLNAVKIAALSVDSVVTGITNGSHDVAAAAAAISANAAKSSGVELKLYETVTIGDGSYAANPYLQETPEPISKVCWDNFVAISKKMADAQGWKEGDIIKVSANGYSVELPLIFQPGQLDGTASIPLGFGRTKAGATAFNIGKNAYPFVGTGNSTFGYYTSGVTLEKVGSDYPLARTQTHHTIDDSRPIIREASLASYEKDKYAGNAATKHIKDNYDELFFTLYGPHPVYGSHQDKYERGHHWALQVDLNTCIGCGACATACHIENNVPVVGQNEVFRVHEMHWMRIDRYYSGDLEHPSVNYMPMICHHCDNAPCENVCPVAATNHSGEGINQMAYNRCIGTRYCANNCPYKVRRFNWFDYQGSDSFYGNTVFDNDEYIVVNDDLFRMVLNPDVTVRSRGVMEKCSFCIQRIQDGKLQAKKEGRQLRDGDVVTACQQSCPTDAITFGDRNNKETIVAQSITDERNYYLLEELHVVPSVSYLTRISHREIAEVAHHGGGNGHQQEGAHDTHEHTPEADTTKHGGA